jgi:hypothetical protein
LKEKEKAIMAEEEVVEEIMAEAIMAEATMAEVHVEAEATMAEAEAYLPPRPGKGPRQPVQVPES